MPPYPLWMRGPDNIRQWMLGVGSVCRGSRLVPTVANGMPAFGHYHPTPDGGYRAWAVQVLEISDGRITGDQLVPRHPRVVPALRAPAHVGGGGHVG